MADTEDPTAPTGGSTKSDGAADGVTTADVASAVPEERNPTFDQATFFRAVESSNLAAIGGLLKQGTVDVNALDADGVNALMLAVYQFEERRSPGLITCLLENGSNPNVVAAPSCDRRICISKGTDAGAGASSGSSGAPASSRTHAVGLGNTGTGLVSEAQSTKKIALAGKAPLLVALELKSALYVKGWDYRHWDAVLSALAFATVNALEAEQEAIAKSEGVPLPAEERAAVAWAGAVANGWAAVFASGQHETLEVWAEGKHITVLKLLLITNSKVLKLLVEAGELQRVKGRVELKDASFTVIREIVSFLYSGRLDHSFLRTRGIDVLLAAHKYQVAPLKEAIVHDLEANPDNWIKLLSVALEVGARSLVLKCAQSICATMEERSMRRNPGHMASFASSFAPPVGNPELSIADLGAVPPIKVWRDAELAADPQAQVLDEQ